MKTYIASPFFNETQLSQVKEIENLLNNLGDEFYSPRMHGNFSELKLSDKLSDVAKSLIFEDNIYQIKTSERVIVNLNGHRDIGTLFELGIALGLKKKVSIILDKDSEVTDDYVYNFEGVLEVKYKIISNTSINFVVNYLNKIDVYFPERTKITIDTLDKDSFSVGIIMLGYFYSIGCKVSYISDFVSKSNLMISQSGIKQYKSEEDYKNGVSVDYSKMIIQ